MKSMSRFLAFTVALPLTAGALAVGSSEPAEAFFSTGDSVGFAGEVSGTIPPLDPTITFPTGQVIVSGAGDGGFAALTFGTIGDIFDVPPPSAFPPPLDPFITFDLDGDSVPEFTFTLDAPPVVDITTAGDVGQVFFTAFGRVSTPSHGSARVLYDFTAEGLGDGPGPLDAFGPIDTNGDGVIGIGDFSGTTIAVIPEPSTIMGSILALGGAAALYRKKRQLKAKA